MNNIIKISGIEFNIEIIIGIVRKKGVLIISIEVVSLQYGIIKISAIQINKIMR
ncbi:MAG: hypothetical protein ACTSRP_03880 [Candidatus Helarchaeota archaeon]